MLIRTKNGENGVETDRNKLCAALTNDRVRIMRVEEEMFTGEGFDDGERPLRIH